ncbi:MAG: metallophosphoesterase family protein [Bacillota bacterium]|nr:metallophosphoesterase family protein [Bacillota bacterium]
MRIGVVSDTHVPDHQRAIPEAILRGLRGVDLIIHAGDLTTLAVLDVLGQIAPVHAVSGNMDAPEVRNRLEKTRIMQVAGKTIGVMHGQGPPGDTEALARQNFPEADVVVFGHTHRPFLERRGRTLIFNPGPAARTLWGKASYGILHIEDDPGAPVKAEIRPI